MKEIVERLHENRQIAIAKEILESNGYSVTLSENVSLNLVKTIKNAKRSDLSALSQDLESKGYELVDYDTKSKDAEVYNFVKKIDDDSTTPAKIDVLINPRDSKDLIIKVYGNPTYLEL